jgi:Spy/CpxP family protein refolding chaperone
MNHRIMSLVAGAMVLIGASAGAQRTDTLRPRARAGRVGGRGRAGGPPPDGPRRQMLAREVRQAFQGVVRRQLGLTDEQAKRLEQVDTRYAAQRTEVNKDERSARQSLRAALDDTGTAPDQGKVDDYVNRLLKAQRRKADIQEAEQKDLSAFLTPVQRAKYLGLREQLNQRIQQIARDGRGGLPPDGPPPGAPPGAPPAGPPPER